MAAAAMDHPNMGTIYEFDQADDKASISMAYIEGWSLRKRIDSGAPELEEALQIATQVAEALQEAHNKGIAHRDIRSANIMVTARGQAKVMDFGLATGSSQNMNIFRDSLFDREEKSAKFLKLFGLSAGY